MLVPPPQRGHEFDEVRFKSINLHRIARKDEALPPTYDRTGVRHVRNCSSLALPSLILFLQASLPLIKRRESSNGHLD